jgi:hypothetical protein
MKPIPLTLLQVLPVPPESVGTVESYGVAAATFCKGVEALLKRDGTAVYRKEGTRVPSVNTGDLLSMR